MPDHDYEIEGFIKAPENSFYRNGIFNFALKYPEDYPANSPLLIFKTKIFHCNVFEKQKNDFNKFLYLSWKEDDLSIILGNLYGFFIFHNLYDPFDCNSAEIYIRNHHEFEIKCQEYVKKYASLEFKWKIRLFISKLYFY